MKKLLLLFSIVYVGQLNAQKICTPFYVTNNNDTIRVKRALAYNYPELQNQVLLVSKSDDTLIFYPPDIKAFAFKAIKIRRYQSVTLDGLSRFLQISIDGTYLKLGLKYDPPISYNSRSGDRVSYVLCQSGDCTTLNPDYGWAQALADYPLLSNIIKEKKFWTENESVLFYRRGFKFILNEYNVWIANKKNGLITYNDTTMALRGVLDANKYFNKRINFVFNFLANGLLTPLVGGPVAFISGGKNPIFLKIPNKEYRKDPDYVAGYKARAYQLKSKAAVYGHLWGYTLLVAVIAARVALGK